jgi:integrase
VKWFSSVGTLFKLADDNELLTANPFAKIALERPKRAQKSRREEWETEELQTLFDSPVYAEHKRPRGGAGEAAYWLPILALYHGFRAGELCQLDTADVVKRAGGIWCLSIRPSAEDDEADPDRHGKSVKTDTSIRVVPIHSAVIALGFLDYVKSMKGRKLFPKVRVDSIGRWGSKWFGRYRNDIGLGGRWRDFHSFRHGWKTAARGASIPKEIHDEITGHDNGDVGSGYGKFPIPRFKAELEKIVFDVSIPKWKPPR